MVFSWLNTLAKVTIKKGFKSSIGWNRGKKGISIHLLDPFTSTPKKGTRINKNKNIIKNKLETLIKSLCFSEEKKNYKKYSNNNKKEMLNKKVIAVCI